MAIGMSYDEYWHSNDPQILWEYLEADRLRQERENNIAWLHGAYMLRAISSTVLNAMRKPGTPPLDDYPERPIPITTRNTEEERDEEQEALIAQVWMNNFVRQGKEWGKKP